MSLDVYLEGDSPSEGGSGIFVRDNGQTREITQSEWDERFPGQEPIVCAAHDDGYVYQGNITHNLGTMAREAGIYSHLWRPDELGIERAAELVEPLEAGLERLCADPAAFKRFNPENGWGDYDGLVRFVGDYLKACRANPSCKVSVWR